MALSKRLNTGRKPPNASLAWWYLSREAKKVLLEERLKGRFGGTPGLAPYWLVQEQGEPKASVEALFYLRKALTLWQSTAERNISQWLRAR